MTDPIAYTRRQFLNQSLAMIATVSSAPAFLLRTSSAMSQVPGTTPGAGIPGGDRVLVVVQMSGGNDGLNTVVPFGSAYYQRARPQLGIRESDALVLDDHEGIGLHPSMRAIHDLVAAKRCAIVQGVGYPNPNRSHFSSMDIWHSGVSLDEGGRARVPRGTGWLGRALDGCEGDPAMACIAIGSEAPPATQGRTVKPIAFERSDLFRWAAGDRDPSLEAVYQRLQQFPAARDDMPFIFRTAMDAQVAGGKVRAAVAQSNETAMPRTELGRQLAHVANMIRAELPTRVYYVAMGGFDTHAGQIGRHPNLLRDFSEAIGAFHDELDATGHGGRVLTLAFSEFGRRVAQNASAGTDHGAAGPTFLFGEHLRTAGLVGKHPPLDQLDDNGDLVFHTDFRGIYADVLSNWMKLDPVAALGGRFAATRIVTV